MLEFHQYSTHLNFDINVDFKVSQYDFNFNSQEIEILKKNFSMAKMY